MSKRRKQPKKTKAAKKRKPPVKVESEKGSFTQYLEAARGSPFTERELIDPLDEDLRDAWFKLRAYAAELGPQRIYASVKTIMFSRKVCYFFVRPKKKHIEVWLFVPHAIEGLVSTKSSSKKVKFSNLFKLEHPDQVEEPLTDWIREAYEFASTDLSRK